jgi:Ca2+-binding EF-hand superfamily protein
MNANADGEICFSEFSRVIGPEIYKQHSMDEIKKVFNFFDTDGSGTIECNELQEAFKRMGKLYSKADIDIMLSQVDADHSGRLTLDEFAKLLSK